MKYKIIVYSIWLILIVLFLCVIIYLKLNKPQKFSLMNIIDNPNNDELIFTCIRPVSKYINRIPSNLISNIDGKYQRIPIIFVPGICANQLEYNYFNDSGMLWFPPKKMDPDYWKRIFTTYWMKNDFGQNTYKNINGLLSNPVFFGTLKGIDFLSNDNDIIPYFKYTSDVLRSVGYRDGHDLFGAPYEFRLILDRDVLTDWKSNLRSLVETAYNKNNFTKVALMAHSVGCQLTHAFLCEMSKQWKDKYIDKYISVAASYGGSSMAFKSIINGKQIGKTCRSMSSVVMMLPNDDIFGYMDILTIGDKKYRVNQYSEIFDMIDFNKQYLQSIPFIKLMDKSNEVNNELFVAFSRPTECMYIYKNSLTDDPIKLYENDYYKILKDQGRWPSGVFSPEEAIGDGVVPFLSIYHPIIRWTDGSIKKFIKTNSDHVGILSDEKFLTTMVETVHKLS